MNSISHLLRITTGISLDKNNTLAQEALQFERSTVTPGGKAAAHAATVPPEIIHLIVNYLDNKDLVKVITLNWTWAHIAAAKLWQEVHFTVNAHRIVFLITKSIPPLVPTDELLQLSSGETSSSIASSSPSADLSSSSPPAGCLSSMDSSENQAPSRRNSYPWPTLLPYHSMVQSLKVSLSSTDMIQDLMEIIPCCSELRSFSIQSAVPTEDLLMRGVIASACNDFIDPLHEIRTSVSPASIAKQFSHAAIPPSRQHHTHVHTLSVDPYNLTTAPRAGLRATDDETIMASTTSQSGILFKLLAKSCPKLEKLWFSGFHPVSVLGAPTDLRSRPANNFDAILDYDLGKLSSSPHMHVNGGAEHAGTSMAFVQPPIAATSNDDGHHTVPYAANSTCSTTTNPSTTSIHPSWTNTGSSAIPPLPTFTRSNICGQSMINILQFVDCTLPSQYLLTMIQHSLPNLTALHLTQCWPKGPINGSFLVSLAKICPGLRDITLHATQSHRAVVSSEHVLQMLKGLEDGQIRRTAEIEASVLGPITSAGYRPYSRLNGEDASVGSSAGVNAGAVSLAEFPLGALSGSKYNTLSISSTAATASSLSMPSSNSSSSSALANLPSSTFPPAESKYNGGDIRTDSQDQPVDIYGSLRSLDSLPQIASALESVSIWFTHSILDQAITDELANSERHPKLIRVVFGSEDTFDSGEECIKQLRQRRPELAICSWVGYGDAGEDNYD
ncbi:hypothetical protein BX616_006781 [Lobosporangium transversale]|nr:hypothetical protein BX616_006781 [Lobosporangium transversale]